MYIKRMAGFITFVLCVLIINFVAYGNEFICEIPGAENLENSGISKELIETEKSVNNIMLISGEDINSDFVLKSVYSDDNNIKAMLFKYEGSVYPDNISAVINGTSYEIKSQPDENGYVYEYIDNNEIVLSGSAVEIRFYTDNNSTDIINKNIVKIVEAENGMWTASEDGHILYTYNGSSSDVVVPNFYNGKIITGVGGYYVNDEYENIIYGNSNLTGISSVSISEGILNIGHFAFYDISELTTAALPNSIEEIGGAAFAYTSLADDVVIPENTKEICAYAFRNSNIKSVKFNNILERIDSQAFLGCSELEGEIVFPDTLNYIGEAAFYQCVNISGGITIPGSVYKVGDMAFYFCRSLNGAVIFKEGVSEIGDFAFTSYSGYMSAINEIQFPSTLKKIGCFAFQYATKVTELNLPEGLEVISDGAFNHMTGINNTVITIPSTVNVIGGDYNVSENTGYGCHVFYDFGKNTSFTTFQVEAGNEYFTAVDGVLYSKNMTRMVAYPRGKTDTIFEIPEGVTQIDEMAFSRAAYLEKIILPDSYIISTEVPENVLNQNGNSLSVAIYVYTTINEIGVKDTNENYTTVDGILYSKDMKSLWYIPNRYEGNIDIAEGTENMEKGCVFVANRANTKWSNINIPKTVYNINECTLDFLNTYFTGYMSVDNSIYYEIDYETNKITEISFIFGDVNMNESIDNSDIALVLKYISGITDNSVFNRKAADYNNDGIIDIRDAVKIFNEIDL